MAKREQRILQMKTKLEFKGRIKSWRNKNEIKIVSKMDTKVILKYWNKCEEKKPKKTRK